MTDSGMAPGPAPSPALWAEENDISPEDLADAYKLGIKSNDMLNSGHDRVNEGLASHVDVGKYLAIDCEMVGSGQGGFKSLLARVSIVDFHGRQIYDSYVRPTETVTDWRTPISGVGPKNMRFARDFEEVQKQVGGLLQGRVLIGHDVRHDLDALLMSHPAKEIRDTSTFAAFRKFGSGPKPPLRVLSQEILGVAIQDGAHSSIEDARVAMLLFRRFKSGFDLENARRFPNPRQDQHRQSKNNKRNKSNRKHRSKS
jgi:RNA exonuclease 4